MTHDLQDQFLNAVMRLKKAEMHFPPEYDIHMSEFIVMLKLTNNCFGSGKNVYITDIMNGMFISKSAVSQLLNSLEHKGYICRKIDTVDRRKISIVLTPSGRKSIKKVKIHLDQMLNETISRLGEKDAIQLIVLFNRLVDIMEDMKYEHSTPDDRS